MRIKGKRHNWGNGSEFPGILTGNPNKWQVFKKIAESAKSPESERALGSAAIVDLRLFFICYLQLFQTLLEQISSDELL